MKNPIDWRQDAAYVAALKRRDQLASDAPAAADAADRAEREHAASRDAHAKVRLRSLVGKAGKGELEKAKAACDACERQLAAARVAADELADELAALDAAMPEIVEDARARVHGELTAQYREALAQLGAALDAVAIAQKDAKAIRDSYESQFQLDVTPHGFAVMHRAADISLLGLGSICQPFCEHTIESWKRDALRHGLKV